MTPPSQQNTNARKLPIGWDVILFFALYIIAPSYFAVEFHSSLPLITLSRALLVAMTVMLAIRNRNRIFPLKKLQWNSLNSGLTSCKPLRWGLILYFALLLISDMALFPADKGESLKAIFVLLVEEYFLIWLLTMILDTREKLLTALQVLAISSGCVALLSILGCIFDANPFHWLNTVEREMLMTTYYRLGILRAEAGFGHPVYYGAFCAIMIPLIMYFLEHSPARWQRRLYAFVLSLNLIGLLLSNSRGSLLAFACLLALVVFIRIIKKEFKAFLRTYIPVLVITLLMLAVVVAVLPYGLYFLSETLKSLVSVILPDLPPSTESLLPTPTDPTIPTEPLPEYGENASGTRSRLIQLSGILWTLQRNPLFGLGSNAHVRGLISYEFLEGVWLPNATFDMGLVAIVCQFGILGFIGYTALYGSFFFTTAAKKFRKDALMHHMGLSLVTYFLCLITISGLLKMEWVLFGMMVCLVNIINKEQSAT